jgi:hypothetical protein
MHDRRSWPCQDSLDFGRIHVDVVADDDVTELGHRQLVEGALALLDGELVGAQSLEHDMDVIEVLRPGCVVDEDVVEEYQDEEA